MNEQIAREIQQERDELELQTNAPPKIQKTQVDASKVVWVLGAIAIDLITGYAIWQTTYWFYGALWVLAGAGGLVYSEWLRERVGNNQDQTKISDRGVIVSWIAILVMALITGSVYILGYTGVAWIALFIVAAVVGLFGYHVFQSYRYHNIDDDYVETNREARLEANNQKKIRAAHRAHRVVEAKREEKAVEARYRQTDGAAFDAAMGKSGTVVIPERRQDVQRLVQAVRGSPDPVQTPTNATNWLSLEEFLKEIGLTLEQARFIALQAKDHDDAFEKLVINRGMSEKTNISGKNFRKLYYRDLNPQKAERANGSRP